MASIPDGGASTGERPRSKTARGDPAPELGLVRAGCKSSEWLGARGGGGGGWARARKLRHGRSFLLGACVFVHSLPPRGENLCLSKRLRFRLSVFLKLAPR